MSDKDPPDDAPTARREAKMQAYRKSYWERYRKTRRRVYGTLTNEEYDMLEQRAKVAGRSVWEQIHRESSAYAKREYLPGKSVEKKLVTLISQLRRIGSNLNQIAKEQHSGKPFDHRSSYYALEALEHAARTFVANPQADSDEDDDEPSPS